MSVLYTTLMGPKYTFVKGGLVASLRTKTHSACSNAGSRYEDESATGLREDITIKIFKMRQVIHMNFIEMLTGQTNTGAERKLSSSAFKIFCLGRSDAQ